MRIVDKIPNKVYFEDAIDAFKKSIIKRLEKYSQLVIACDPSKTGYGMCIGDIYGTELAIIEIQSPREDNLLLINKLYDLLYDIWIHLDIGIIGYEEVIHINPKSGNDAYSFNIRNILSDMRCVTRLAGIKSVKVNPDKILPVNNEAWKSAIIGEYNKKGIKGSKIFLQNENPKYSDYSDNMTDAICIYRYLLKLIYPNILWMPKREDTKANISFTSYCIGSINYNENRLKINCDYNYDLSIEDNILRMMYSHNYALFNLNLNKIRLSDFYKIDFVPVHITEDNYLKVLVVKDKGGIK